MLVAASAMLSVTLLTGYSLLLIHRHREDLTCMVTMMLAMGVAMMGSLPVGTVLGVLFNEMFAPTVYAVLAGMAVGYSAGRPVHLMASGRHVGGNHGWDDGGDAGRDGSSGGTHIYDRLDESHLRVHPDHDHPTHT